MYPQAFLRTYWRMELRPQIYVAMSFEEVYQSRFDKIIAPAIRSIQVAGGSLEPYRVDLSETGDSILTDIMDGITHAQLVLADVSTVGKDSRTGLPYRNSNVMYEVGLALACRHSSEILLIRDDRDQFLFDVSTIPHVTIDFSDEDAARMTLQEKLSGRLKEQNYINDARVQLALATLTREEIRSLEYLADLPPKKVWGRVRPPAGEEVDFHGMVAIPRLLEKQLIKFHGVSSEGTPYYELTPLGQVVANLVKSDLKQLMPDPKEAAEEQKGEENS